ncbi:MAG TPA: IspD/TarI family cytidylyltransferase, partial [Planctomycetota bacterium]|nr:IspD/TarI family cytidylyltransferase [Planctomycetota bacterium]
EWIDRIRRRHLDGLRKVVAVVPGGKRRQDSVRAGLQALSTPLVLVHDAARPLIRGEAAKAVAQAAARHGGAVLASRAVDTVKLVDGRGGVVSTPDRSRVWLAETPQGFRRSFLLGAYRKAGRRDATDDAQLVERAGGRVVVVASLHPNFKVTTPKDLERTVNLLDSR